jgi:hypothetical protein
MNLPSLRDLLAQHFSLEELRALCLDLDVEYENLPGETRLAKAQALVTHCLRAGRLPALAQRARALRPAAPWPDGAALADEWDRLQRAKAAQEGLHGVLPDAQMDAVLATLQAREAELLAHLTGGGAVALGAGALAVGERAVHVGGGVGGDVTTGQKLVVTVEQGGMLVVNAEKKPLRRPWTTPRRWTTPRPWTTPQSWIATWRT